MVLQAMAEPGEATLVTHHDFPAAIEPDPTSASLFSVFTSPAFSALLTGIQVETWVTQVELTFAPEAIAQFLHQLATHCPSAWHDRLLQASSIPQPNSTRQSEFTLRLLDVLSTPASEQDFTLARQIEQERLLRQVTSQIRQSLDLPVILQTAVEQGRKCLQVDRLIIYQLHMASAHPMGGFVIHEARASERSPRCCIWVKTLCFD
ncbi:MAG: GAF domain-containing protein, partial [Leptolyngbyaceae cyanobacterium SL_7_1]|nr:GAF domain-containing protein [Leptolyngbyaceae cyanobacterium SL_7_1]